MTCLPTMSKRVKMCPAVCESLEIAVVLSAVHHGTPQTLKNTQGKTSEEHFSSTLRQGQLRKAQKGFCHAITKCVVSCGRFGVCVAPACPVRLTTRHTKATSGHPIKLPASYPKSGTCS